MYENELIQAIKWKETGYNNICRCTNAKVVKSSLQVIENTERINMRGIFLKEINGKVFPEVGLTTSKKIIDNLFIPAVKQYRLSSIESVLKAKREKLDNIHSSSKYRMDLLKAIKGIYKSSARYLILNDTKYGRMKANTLHDELLYMYGTILEKKLIAANNNHKRLQNKLIKYIDNN